MLHAATFKLTTTCGCQLLSFSDFLCCLCLVVANFDAVALLDFPLESVCLIHALNLYLKKGFT